MLDLLLPQRCLVCGSRGSQLCPGCAGRLPRVLPPLCLRCGAPTVWPVARCRECAGRRVAFRSARAALTYEAGARTVVAGWKEHGLRHLAAVAADLVAEMVPRPDAMLVTFVPPDGDRSLRRGHHPPERLARELGRRWQLPVRSLLGRTRHVDRQRGLPREQRRRNVADAFRPRGRVPARVVLVDDVYTSGATVSAAASALRAGGARKVDVVTLARAIRAG